MSENATTPYQANYLKMLELEGLSPKDLPNDIKGRVNMIAAQIGKHNKQNTEKTLATVSKMDKDICNLIDKWFEEKDKPAVAEPIVAASVVEPTTIVEEVSNNGITIDNELAALSKEGKATLTLAELKSSAPETFKTIWDLYKEGEENGISTSNFSIMESGKEQFTLNKI